MVHRTSRDQYSRKRLLATEAGRLVDEAVTHIRNRGYTRERAILEVANSLGLQPHRAKKLAYNEVDTLDTDEYLTILFRFQGHLDAEAQNLASRLASIKKRRRQLESQHASTGRGMGAAEDRGPSDLDCRWKRVSP